MADLSKMSVGFIGSGVMGSLIANGLVHSGAIPKSSVVMYDKSPEVINKAQSEGFTARMVSAAAFQHDIIWLCVKPHHVDDTLDLAPSDHNRSSLMISIVNGVTLEHLSKQRVSKIARLMPNTATGVLSSVNAYCVNDNCSDQDAAIVDKLCSSFGKAFNVSEDLFPAVVGVSGSGIALFYIMIDSMADAGVAAGLPRKLAIEMAAQTAAASGKMVLETNQHPQVLKDQVCSPKGATIKAVAKLEETGFRNSVISAASAAANAS